MGAKYESYLEYKDTGIDWLPSVPVDWQVLPLKLAAENKVKDGPHETPKFLDEGVPFFSVDSIQNSKLVFEDCRYISREDHERFSMKCLPKFGDVLLGKAASVGKVAYVDTKEEFNVWSPLAVLTLKSIKLGRFIFYSLQSTWLQAQCDVSSNSNTQKNLSMGVIDNLSFAIPSDDMAEKIANFLDHETAKIDTLIEKQQQLIKLLKEKRQAVISHAVTKGLNPKAPMRDSGVEWLGEVPKHWGVKKFKFLCDRIIAGPFGSSIKKDMYVKHGYKVYGQEQVIPNDFGIGDYYISEKDCFELTRYIVGVGDILISCVGTFGKIAVFPRSAEQGIINPRLIKAEVCQDHNPYYIRELLKSEMVFKQFELLSRGGTMGVINIAILSDILAAVPPESEQSEVVEYINLKKEKFSTLVNQANNAVQLLQERRTALISAAVTGKIDVRNWQAPN